MEKSYNIVKLPAMMAVIALAIGLIAGTAGATNGMNLEAFGPEAMGMGGAAYAYDNGTAATMNNPATIGLMDEGHRFDLAVGFLSPDVDASQPGMASVNSASDLFLMPAIGWVSKKGKFAYGISVFGQGGMGTEFDAASFLAKGSGETVRSEVSVGRAMIPLTYNVTDDFIIGTSIGYVWVGMDIKMALSGREFGDMVASLGGTQSQGRASGTMVDALAGSIGTLLNNGAGAGDGLGTGPVNWARFDFSDDNDFTGEASGQGFAGKIGLAYRVTPRLTIGATYHSKTSIDDLETENAMVTMSANVDTGLAAGAAPSGVYAAQLVPVMGQISVMDFQWPETYGVGFSYQATDKLMVAVDVKRIMWADVMEDFSMVFTSYGAALQSGLAAGFADMTLSASLDQKWENQTIIALGMAYQFNEKLTVRCGYNYASNPVPDTYLNALFPAIVESHATIGLGYRFTQNFSIDMAMSKGFSENASNQTAVLGAPITSEHSQLNGQFMFTYKY